MKQLPIPLLLVALLALPFVGTAYALHVAIVVLFAVT